MPGPKRSSTPALPGPTMTRKIRSTARRVVTEIGGFVAGKHRSGGQRMQRKGRGDFVTEIDLAAEHKLRRLLIAAHPEHGILGEELPPHRPDAEFTWILDPIDGTSNFGRGLPTYAVSAACLYHGTPIAAAVHCMPEAVTYSAGRGLGASRGRQRLQLAKGRISDAAIIGIQWHRGDNRLGYLETLTATGTRLRNMGCTVAQLCDVAAGRLDANIQEQGKIWDFAAAALILMEAGGKFTDWQGQAIFPVDYDPNRHHPSIAAPPGVHGQLCRLLGSWHATAKP